MRWDRPRPSGAGSVSRRTARDDPVVVGQRLAHAHEHDVGQPAGAAGTSPPRSQRAPAHDLLDDLGGGQVAGQPGLAGRAERAGHPAAGLAGDADRDPVRVAHQHALDQRAVVARHSVLRVAPPSQADVRTGVSSGGSSAAASRSAGGRRQVGHRGRVALEPAEVVLGQLLGPERRLAELGHRVPPLGGGRGRRGAAAACRRGVGASKTSGRVVMALPLCLSASSAIYPSRGRTGSTVPLTRSGRAPTDTVHRAEGGMSKWGVDHGGRHGCRSGTASSIRTDSLSGGPMKRRLLTIPLVAAAALVAGALPVSADPTPISGAIFTTDVTGVPVNLNIYAAKQDVYLNGGPGINAPVGAAGLPAGTYRFQVTDPSGKTLLSTDAVACRQFTVDASGVIQSVAPGGACAHATGINGDDSGITVQLFPFADTPNNGGVYKVWVTPTSTAGLLRRPGNKNCFVPGDSKTDNFKVREGAIVEIDTRFFKGGTGGRSMGWRRSGPTPTARATSSAPSTTRGAGVPRGARGGGRAGLAPDHRLQPGEAAPCGPRSGPTARPTWPAADPSLVPVSVKSHNTGDRTYFVDVQCAA